jgi:hypothetical protein
MNLIIKAISLVGNHVIAMKNDPAKIGENFVPLSTAVGLAGGSFVAATSGATESMDIHSSIGGWETTEQIASHVIMYALQLVIGAYSAYLVGKPRGVSIDD